MQFVNDRDIGIISTEHPAAIEMLGCGFKRHVGCWGMERSISWVTSQKNFPTKIELKK